VCGRVAAGILAALLLSSCGGGFFLSSTISASLGNAIGDTSLTVTQ